MSHPVLSSPLQAPATPLRQRARLALITAGLALAGPSVQAGSIYQCKQAGGAVTFQEQPCAPSAVQSTVGQTHRSAAPPASPGPAAKGSAVPTDASPDTTAAATCRQTGIQVFDPTRAQSLQHPQAALNSCRKTLPAPLNKDGLCLDACIQAWVGQYQKTYLGKGS